jgi:hypothetical protein
MLAYLLPAISAAFAANSTLTTAFPGNTADGGTQYGIALDPDDTFDAPFVRVTVISAPREVVYGGTGRNNPQIQFDVIAKGANAARAAMLTFVGVWDTVTLSPASGQLYYGTRITDPMPLPDSEGRDENADTDVWAWSCVYEYATRN